MNALIGGQCVAVCPVGALTARDHTNRLLEDLDDPDKVVIVQTAPAVRVALGEEFGLPAGTPVTGKMVYALRELGFIMYSIPILQLILLLWKKEQKCWTDSHAS